MSEVAWSSQLQAAVDGLVALRWAEREREYQLRIADLEAQLAAASRANDDHDQESAVSDAGHESVDRVPESPPPLPRSSPPQAPQLLEPVSPRPFKYVEVVRDRVKRKAMHAYDCACCAKYYDMTADLRQPDDNVKNSASKVKEQARQERLRISSRHRARHKPPSTPDGFWDVNFDEQVAAGSPVAFPKRRH